MYPAVTSAPARASSRNGETEVNFIDIALARRVEMAEANAARSCAEAFSCRHPEFPVAVENIGGGVALYAGPDSPVTQAIGVGINGDVTDADLERLTHFFLRRKANAAAEICPFVDPRLYERFAARGYRLLEVSNVLILNVAEFKPAAPPPGVLIRAAEPNELKLWTSTVSQGFAEHFPVTPDLLEVMEGFAHRRNAASLLAFVDGEVAGGGAVSAHEGVGGLFGASTLPAFRRRGVQTALLSARIAWAASQNCDLAVSIALPGSISHRNIERFGFRVAYTRTKLVLPLNAVVESELPSSAS
jgi:GNAT superfamily N-acetyltransferase